MSEQNVNLILKQEESTEEEVVVSFSAIIRKASSAREATWASASFTLERNAAVARAAIRKQYFLIMGM